MNRNEHVQWCKDRALKYVDKGDLTSAFASMGSDLKKHPDTKNHAGVSLGLTLMISGKLSTQDEMREFINGFH